MSKRDKKGLWAGVVRPLLGICALALLIRSLLFEPFHIPSDSMLPNLMVGDHLFVNKTAYGYSKRSFPFSPPIFRGRVFFREPDIGDVVVFKNIGGGAEDNYIKRLIGRPGDRIQVRRGRLYINGKPCPRAEAGRFFVLNLPMRLRHAASVSVPASSGKTLVVIGGREVFLGSEKLARDEYTIAYKTGREYRGEALELKRYVETLPNGVEHFIIEYSDGYDDMDNTAEYLVPPGKYFMMGDNRDFSQDSRVMEKVGFVDAQELMGRAVVIFYSHNNSVRFWEFWSWLGPVRFERLLRFVK